eukprot:GAHX01001701.1.p1 GENE.GAHX01001701.1~~GAHX01001701.1.p1  ORF type:complete len:178 (+),score=17.07 GAHX01001701.1:42-536(+)
MLPILTLECNRLYPSRFLYYMRSESNESLENNYVILKNDLNTIIRNHHYVPKLCLIISIAIFIIAPPLLLVFTLLKKLSTSIIITTSCTMAFLIVIQFLVKSYLLCKLKVEIGKIVATMNESVFKPEFDRVLYLRGDFYKRNILHRLFSLEKMEIAVVVLNKYE